MRTLIIVLALLFASLAAHAQVAPAAVRVPSADEALAAWQAFEAAPLTRLDRTQPFLDFIRDSGQVHIVLNEHLLAWMYEKFDEEMKAVLYASFLGGHMAAQLARGDTPEEPGADDLAAVRAALAAYGQVRKAHPEVKLALFETFAEAEAAGRLATDLATISAGDEP